MKKDRSKTNGYTLILIVFTLFIFIMTAWYLKWYFVDRPIQKEQKQRVEMIYYQQSQGRTVQFY